VVISRASGDLVRTKWSVFIDTKPCCYVSNGCCVDEGGEEWEGRNGIGRRNVTSAHSTTEATYPSLDSTGNAKCLSFAESNWSMGSAGIGGESIAASGEVASRQRTTYSGGLRCSRMTNWKTMVMRALKRACWTRAKRWWCVWPGTGPVSGSPTTVTMLAGETEHTSTLLCERGCGRVLEGEFQRRMEVVRAMQV
jgi:hypothetical protein